MGDMLSDLKQTLIELRIEDIQKEVRRCLDAGIEPWRIIKEGMSEAMLVVGDKFQSGEYYLADLVLAGATMKEGMELLKDKIEAASENQKGAVVLATVQGDIHDIGKNIVATMLSAAGHRVIDLGVDVPPSKIVEALKQSGASGLGLSCLLTTMIEGIRATLEAVRKAGLRGKVRIAIGGACTSEALAKELGADAHGQDAVQAVRIFQELVDA